MAIVISLSASITKQTKKSGKIQTAGICVASSIVLHVAVAVVIGIRMITIDHEKATEANHDKSDKKEMIIQIKMDQEIPKEAVAPRDLTPPAEERAPLTAEELRALANKMPEPEPIPEELEQPVEQAKPVEVKQTARTTADQLAGVSEETNIEGERNTIAASNARPTAGAPEVSAVSGVEPVDNRINRVDTTFVDGEFSHSDLASKASESQIPPPPTEFIPPPPLGSIPEQPALTKASESEKEPEKEQIKSSVESTDEVGDALEEAKLAQTNQENREFSETINKVAMNQTPPTSVNTGQRESDGANEKRNTIANENLDPDGLKKKAQERREQAAQAEALELALAAKVQAQKVQEKALQKARQEAQMKAAKNQRERAANAAKAGFRSEARATAMQGSISSRSNIASQDVKATPTGKYMALISKQLETAWQRRMNTASHLAYPGMLRVSFMVTKEGTVKNFDSVGLNTASAGQESIVHQAINSDLKIPPMPADVVKSLGGDLLVLEYNFNFQ